MDDDVKVSESVFKDIEQSAEDDVIGIGVPFLPAPTQPSRKVTVHLPRYPGSEEAPTIVVKISESTVDIQVEGHMGSAEEYTAVMSLLSNLV